MSSVELPNGLNLLVGRDIEDRAELRSLIVDSLCYWVEEMHVDGFRFDLASILARDSSGTMHAADRQGAVGSETDPKAE